MGTKRNINKSAKNTFIYTEDTNEQLLKQNIIRGTRAYKTTLQLFFIIYMSMGSQWKFYKIARRLAVIINSQVKTFLDDQLDRVLYFIENSIWIPRH